MCRSIDETIRKSWLVIGEVNISYVHVAELLFISYMFVNGFWAITFVLPVFSNWNFQDVCQRFSYNWEQNFSLIRQKTKNFSIDPNFKITHFCNVMCMDMTLQKWAIFYNRDLWGNFSFFVGSNWNFVLG